MITRIFWKLKLDVQIFAEGDQINGWDQFLMQVSTYHWSPKIKEMKVDYRPANFLVHPSFILNSFLLNFILI